MITELMDRFADFAMAWLWLVLLASWRALPILILVIGIGFALRRKLSPSLHALLLTVVVIRLLIPISIGSPLSVHKPIDNWLSSDSEELLNQYQHREARDHVYAVLPKADATETQWLPSETGVQLSRSTSFNTTWEILCLAALGIVVSVSILLLVRSIISHTRFALKLKSCRLLDDQQLVDLLLRECDSLAVGRRPAIREVPSLAAPAVFGLFRHTICLPPSLTEILTEQELRWVIRHELAHIRRYDIPVVIIASIAGAFHWFNPIVWMITRRLRGAMEAAADKLALQSLSESDAAAYGKLLLRFADSSVAGRRSPTLGLISFASGKDLKQRITLLMRDSKPSGFSAKIMSSGLVTAIGLVGLTDAREVSDEKMPEFHLIVSDSIELNLQPMWNDPFVVHENDGPTFIETYDIASIFETMPESLSGSNKSAEEQLASWMPLPSSLEDKLHVEGKMLSAELTARQHQLLKQTVEIWKEGEPKQVLIEARIIQTNIQTASSIDWAGGRIEGLTVKGLGPAIAARIDEPELAQLVRTVSADRKGNIMFAPKVTLFDGQTAEIADQVQRPFVTGVDPKADGRMQPIVSVVDEGLSFVLTPKAGDDDSITLDFKVKATSIGKVSYANLPIRTSKNAQPQFTVQVPATEQYEVSSSVTLAAGESVVVAIPRVFDNKPGADAATTLIVTLTPRLLIPESHVTTEPTN
jgi:beta-lactamase regulating signal transducer with metallopeptidase domain